MRSAAHLAWASEPWTCPQCTLTIKAGGKGSHLTWCGKRETHFWAKVYKTDTCWLYEGVIGFEGYGYVNVGSGAHRKQYQAHRYAWELTNGPLNQGECLLHRCDVRHCVRQDHLYVGDRKDNARDMYERGRDVTRILNEDQVIEIRGLFGTMMQREIAERYGVSRQVINKLSLGKTYRSVGNSPLPQVERSDG